MGKAFYLPSLSQKHFLSLADCADDADHLIVISKLYPNYIVTISKLYPNFFFLFLCRFKNNLYLCSIAC